MKARTYYLRFKAPVTELPRAPALFGHLAWMVLWHEGRVRLEAFLQAFEEGPPPFLLSSAFPVARKGEDRLPLLPRPKRPPLMEKDTRKRKTLKRIRYLSFSLFRKVAEKGDAPLAEAIEDGSHTLFHEALVPRGYEVAAMSEARTRVGIARASGTHAPGVLFTESALRIREAVIYAAFSSPTYGPAWFADLLMAIGRQGYGGKKSIGYGVFDVEDGGEIELPEAPGANAHTLLSPALPPEGDGWYGLEPYWGRLGEHFALGPNPFKRVYIRAVEGSTFRNPPEGKLLDVTPEPAPETEARVREYLFPFTLGVRV